MWDNIEAFKDTIKLIDKGFFALQTPNQLYDVRDYYVGEDISVCWSMLEEAVIDRLIFLGKRRSPFVLTATKKNIKGTPWLAAYQDRWRRELEASEEEINRVTIWLQDEYHDIQPSELFDVFSFMSWVKKTYAENYGYDRECWGWSGPFSYCYGYYLSQAIDAYYTHRADIDPVIQKRIKREKEAQELEDRKNSYWDRVAGMVHNSPPGTASQYVKTNREPT